MKRFIFSLLFLLISFDRACLADKGSSWQFQDDSAVIQETVSLFHESKNGAALIDRLQGFLSTDELVGLEKQVASTKGKLGISVTATETELLVANHKLKMNVHLKILNRLKGEFTLNGQAWTFQPWETPVENMRSIAKVLQSAKDSNAANFIDNLLNASLYENSAEAVLGIDDGILATIYLMGAGLTFAGCGVQWLLDEAHMPVTSPAVDLSKLPGSCFGAAAGWPLFLGAAIFQHVIGPMIENTTHKIVGAGAAPHMDGLQCNFRTDPKTKQEVFWRARAHYSNGFTTDLENATNGLHLVKVNGPEDSKSEIRRAEFSAADVMRFDLEWRPLKGAGSNGAAIKMLQASCENPVLRAQFATNSKSNEAGRGVLERGSAAKPRSAGSSESIRGSSQLNAK